jgi:MYXO-CTERM domain-containing protein
MRYVHAALLASATWVAGCSDPGEEQAAGASTESAGDSGDPDGGVRTGTVDPALGVDTRGLQLFGGSRCFCRTTAVHGDLGPLWVALSVAAAAIARRRRH